MGKWIIGLLLSHLVTGGIGAWAHYKWGAKLYVLEQKFKAKLP